MVGAESTPLKRAPVVRQAPRAGARWLLSYLLYAIFVTAVAAVVVAAAMGQSTLALVVGLVSAAFFAGILS